MQSLLDMLPTLGFSTNSPTSEAPSSSGPEATTSSMPVVGDLPNEQVVELHRVVKSLYDLSADVKEVFARYYVPDTASFVDPLVCVYTTHDCVGQFRALQGLFDAADVDDQGVTDGDASMMIDWTITFYPKGTMGMVWLSLPVLTVLKLTRDEATDEVRIQSHTDHWSVHELLNQVPVVGFFYSRLWRHLVGKASSYMTNALHDLLVGDKDSTSTISTTGEGSG